MVKQRRTDTEKVKLGGYFGAIDRYYNSLQELAVVNVHPGGQNITSSSDEMMVAVVGASVCACVRDPVSGISGMNHFLFPSDASDEERFYTGAFAMEMLINEILESGSKKSRLEVKLFGGASIGRDEGVDNQAELEFMERYIKNEKLNMVVNKLGGKDIRCVHYHSKDGKVRVRKLRRQEDLNNIFVEETEHVQDLLHLYENKAEKDEVLLFGSEGESAGE